MKLKQLVVIGLTAASLLGATSVSLAGKSSTNESVASTSFAADVRHATATYQDVGAAKAAGYALFHGCVSGPDQGAMGVHFVNGDLVGDGALDVNKPEALIYEQRGGRMQLVAVEYVVLAADWNAKNAVPPTLKGQLFDYNSSPNRYGIPAFYSLHVWAWKTNPSGMFADWNPRVSCEEFTGEGM
jgi:hypothetical protein